MRPQHLPCGLDVWDTPEAGPAREAEHPRGFGQLSTASRQKPAEHLRREPARGTAVDPAPTAPTMPRPTSGLASGERLRAELVALLRGANAHTPVRACLRGIPPQAINVRAPGLPHTLWEQLYHLWFTQNDILLFCQNADYTAPEWPAAYWPAAPATGDDWALALADFGSDLSAMIELANTGDLTSEFRHAPGYTLLREVLLVADHNSHHTGQVIDLRRSLGLWPPPEAN